MTDLELLDLEQAAAQLRVSVDWLTKAARAGVVPSRKVGQSRRFTPQDLSDYLDSVREGADRFARNPRSQSRVGRTRRTP